MALSGHPRDRIRIRWAIQRDLLSLIGIAKRFEQKQQRLYLESAISRRECLVATRAGRPAGFAVFNTGAFFDQTFIWLLVSAAQYRRKGVATALIHRIERICPNEKLFTSTNQSNKAMHALMRKLEYNRAGIVRGLDPGDPEVFYVKKLRGSRRSRAR